MSVANATTQSTPASATAFLVELRDRARPDATRRNSFPQPRCYCVLARMTCGPSRQYQLSRRQRYSLDAAAGARCSAICR